MPSKDINLVQLLGIEPTPSDQKRMPKQFDRRNQDLWKDALVSGKMWEEWVSAYIRLCNSRGRNPFAHALNKSDNQEIIFEFRRIRRLLVKYIDDWGILRSYANKRKPPVLMRVARAEWGFDLHCRVTLYDQPDMLDLKRQLEQRQFFKYEGPYKIGKWDWHRRFPGYPMELGVSAASDYEAYLWYNIKISQPPYVDRMPTNTTKPEDIYTEFVVKQLWLPVVLAQRLWSLNLKF